MNSRPGLSGHVRMRPSLFPARAPSRCCCRTSSLRFKHSASSKSGKMPMYLLRSFESSRGSDHAAAAVARTELENDILGEATADEHCSALILEDRR